MLLASSPIWRCGRSNLRRVFVAPGPCRARWSSACGRGGLQKSQGRPRHRDPWRFSPLGERYRSLLRRWPFCGSFTVCFTKGVCADLVAQFAIEDCEHWDGRRTLAVAFFSGSFTGCGYHLLFNVIFARVFGAAASCAVVLKKTAMDAFVTFPFMYMPWFFVCDEFIRYGNYEGIYDRWRSEIRSCMTSYVQIWPWALLCLFTVVPVELRTTFTAAVSFAWLVLLSLLTNPAVGGGSSCGAPFAFLWGSQAGA